MVLVLPLHGPVVGLQARAALSTNQMQNSTPSHGGCSCSSKRLVGHVFALF